MDGKGLWFAAQFCKGADHEVKQESSLDHLATYPLVNRLLQTMGLRISDLQKPFAIFTQKDQQPAIRAWRLETAFQWVLALTVKSYVQMRDVAALLLFSDNILGPSASSVLRPSIMMVDTGKRACITVGLIKGPPSPSKQFNIQELLRYRAYLKSRGLPVRGNQFAQDTDSLTKVFENLRKIKKCPRWDLLKFSVDDLEADAFHDMLQRPAAMHLQTDTVPSIGEIVRTRASSDNGLDAIGTMAAIMARRKTAFKRERFAASSADTRLPGIIEAGLEDPDDATNLSTYKSMLDAAMTANKDAGAGTAQNNTRKQTNRPEAERLADHVAHVSVHKANDQKQLVVTAKAGGGDAKVQMSMPEVECMRTMRDAEAVIATAFRNQLERARPGLLKDYLEGHTGMASGGAALQAPEDEDAGSCAAGGTGSTGMTSGGGAATQAQIQGRMGTYTLAYADETGEDFQEAGAATLEGAGFIREIASALQQEFQEEEEMEEEQGEDELDF